MKILTCQLHPHETERIFPELKSILASREISADVIYPNHHTQNMLMIVKSYTEHMVRGEDKRIISIATDFDQGLL